MAVRLVLKDPMRRWLGAAAGIVGDGAGAELVDDGVSGGVSSMKPKNSWSGSVSSTIGRP